eukprot:gb/GEZN01000854.1/.p1 GENE.gb/GEZN01000854.1/~~gb/GEZN01000854.1/.p1  ORF type:complete len:748 (-),score=48.10 gb/GEZN01000854.1/:169-2412(-)
MRAWLALWWSCLACASLSYDASLSPDRSEVLVIVDGQSQVKAKVISDPHYVKGLLVDLGTSSPLGTGSWVSTPDLQPTVVRPANSTQDELYVVSPSYGVLLRRLFFQPPHVRYESSNPNSSFSCSSQLLLSPAAFSCWLFLAAGNVTYSTTYSLVTSSTSGALASVTTTVSNAGANDIIPTTISQLFFSVALHRLDVQVQVQDQLKLASDMFAVYNDENKGFAWLIWMFAAITMYSLAVLAGVWQTWLWLGCECCLRRGADDCCGWIVYWPGRPFFLWTFFFVIVLNIVCWLGGLTGAIMVGAAMFFFVSCTCGLYTTFHCQLCNWCCRKLIRCCLCCGSARDFAMDKYQFEELGENRQGKINNFNDDNEDDGLMIEDNIQVPVKVPARFLHYCPRALGYGQARWISACSLVLLVGCAVLGGYGYSYDPPSYYVYDRHDYTTMEEPSTSQFQKILAVSYHFQNAATLFKMDPLFRQTSRECIARYSRQLAPSERQQEIQVDWIETFQVDMSIYNLKDYSQYETVNAWLQRSLDPSTAVNRRPVSSPSESNVISSPADSRAVFFPSIRADSEFWIKNKKFTVQTLLGLSSSDSRLLPFEEGSMSIFRLSYQDYHRFHAPVAGVVQTQKYIAGTLFHSARDAMNSENLAIYNQRVVTFVQTRNIGTVAVVIIGSACVGSIYMQYTPPYSIERGELMGYFQFGGSTVVVVFPQNTMKFDLDLLTVAAHNPEKMIETRVRVGEQIGVTAAT